MGSRFWFEWVIFVPLAVCNWIMANRKSLGNTVYKRISKLLVMAAAILWLGEAWLAKRRPDLFITILKMQLVGWLLLVASLAIALLLGSRSKH